MSIAEVLRGNDDVFEEEYWGEIIPATSPNYVDTSPVEQLYPEAYIKELLHDFNSGLVPTSRSYEYGEEFAPNVLKHGTIIYFEREALTTVANTSSLVAIRALESNKLIEEEMAAVQSRSKPHSYFLGDGLMHVHNLYENQSGIAVVLSNEDNLMSVYGLGYKEPEDPRPPRFLSSFAAGLPLDIAQNDLKVPDYRDIRLPSQLPAIVGKSSQLIYQSQAEDHLFITIERIKRIEVF
jgi:hypothetical protein